MTQSDENNDKNPEEMAAANEKHDAISTDRRPWHLFIIQFSSEPVGVVK